MTMERHGGRLMKFGEKLTARKARATHELLSFIHSTFSIFVLSAEPCPMRRSSACRSRYVTNFYRVGWSGTVRSLGRAHGYAKPKLRCVFL